MYTGTIHPPCQYCKTPIGDVPSTHCISCGAPFPEVKSTYTCVVRYGFGWTDPRSIYKDSP